MSELGDKVPAADKEKVDGLVRDLRAAIAAEDFDKIKTLNTDLQQALYGITTNLYQQSGGAAPGGPDEGVPGAGGATSGGGDDVIDADFTESK